MSKLEWKLARRTLDLSERTLLMGILNITPDSFSDGGRFFSLDRARARAEELVEEGADILDIGGESTRPGGEAVTFDEELRRVIPLIEGLARSIHIPISVDTTKSEVAQRALDAGAEIINDISGLRFDPQIADMAVKAEAGLVLMHSRGSLETMHKLPPVEDIMAEVKTGLGQSIEEATRRGVEAGSIAIDPGIGFSKSQEQNLELIAKLDVLAEEFRGFPVLVGTSRKSFIGRLLDDAPVTARLQGTMATVAASVLRGAHIVRVHDLRAARETVRVIDAIKSAQKSPGA